MEKKYIFDNDTGTLTFIDGLDTISAYDYPSSIKKDIKKIVFPASLRTINESTFIHAPNLESVIFNEGLEKISCKAFYNCAKIKSIHLPDSLTCIDGYAFYNTSLDEVHIPKNVNEIYPCAFSSQNQNKIVRLTVDSANENFSVVDEKFLIKKEINENNETLYSLIMCSDYENDKITLPKHITNIAELAFENCNASEIELNEGLLYIQSYCFWNCANLKKLHFPESLLEINGQLVNDNDTEEIYIGKNLHKISYSAFCQTINLKKVVLSPENKNFISDKNNTLLYNHKTLYKSTQGKFPQENIEIIASGCFCGLDDLQEIHFPNSIKELGYQCISDCKDLKKIYIGENVEYISHRPFIFCDNIQDIIINENNKHFFSYKNKGIFRKIENNGEQFCSLIRGIKYTQLPENCIELEKYAFTNTKGLYKITSTNNISNLKELETNSSKDNLYTLYIPNSIKKVGYSAFSECDDLKDVDLKNTQIDTIYSQAFSSNKNLENISFPNSTSIYNSILSQSHDNLKEVSIPFDLDCTTKNNESLFKYGFQNENFKFYVRRNNEQFQIEEPIRYFKPSTCIITSKNTFFEEQNGQLISQPVDFYKEYAKPYNKLEKLHITDSYKVYEWLDKHSNEVPPFYIVKNMNPKDIELFYKNRKIWTDLVKNADLKKYEDIESFFKCCYTLGVFEKDNAGSNKTAKFIEQAILPNLSIDDLHFMFDDCNTFQIGANPDFAELFKRFFVKKDSYGQEIKKNNILSIEGRNFITKIDYLTNTIVSLVPSLYNNFDILKDKNGRKNIKGGHGGYSKLTTNDIINTFATYNYPEEIMQEELEKYELAVKDFKNDKGELKYDSEIFNDFLKILGENGETKEHMIKLAEAFTQGIVNWEKEENVEKRLLCDKDEEKHRITYELLPKTDGHGAIVGIITQCCQRLGDNGGSCVEYGMKMPNSSFIVFRYNNEIIGQAWVWYDEKSKQITLDNIESPSAVIDKIKTDKTLEEEMIKCLLRLNNGFLNAMGDKVEKVTIGLSCNDMNSILTKYFSKIEQNNINELSDYSESINMQFGPDHTDNAYSDATKNKGQLLISSELKKSLNNDLTQEKI